MIEADVMHLAMLEASRRGHRLWRNNITLAVQDGRIIRAGLPKKSSDTIGLCGIDGVFVAVEFKRPGWKPPGRGTTRWPHYEGQLRWHDMVRTHKGRAGFATTVEEALQIIEGRETDAVSNPQLDSGAFPEAHRSDIGRDDRRKSRRAARRHQEPSDRSA